MQLRGKKSTAEWLRREKNDAEFSFNLYNEQQSTWLNNVKKTKKFNVLKICASFSSLLPSRLNAVVRCCANQPIWMNFMRAHRKWIKHVWRELDEDISIIYKTWNMRTIQNGFNDALVCGTFLMKRKNTGELSKVKNMLQRLRCFIFSSLYHSLKSHVCFHCFS